MRYNFPATQIEVENVSLYIKDFANYHNIPTYAVDFTVDATRTYIKSHEADEYHVIEEEKLILKRTDSRLLDPRFEMRQSYIITLYPHDFDKRRNIVIALAADKYLTKVNAVIKKESIIDYDEHLFYDIRQEILKKKALNRLLIGYFDEMMDKEIQGFVAKVQLDGFNGDAMVSVGQGVRVVEPQDGQIIRYYEQKNEQIRDQHNRGFAYGVTKNELVMTFRKPQEGKPGRNLQGKYVGVVNEFVHIYPTFSVNEENLKVIESSDGIDYFARDSGYVWFNKETLDVKKELDINVVNLVKTGSVEIGIDADAKVSIVDGNEIQDSVQSGMRVNAKQIEVSHSIAANTQLDAESVSVNGNTHKESRIVCEEANINIHKGYLECQKASVQSIEHGQVKAKNVTVAHMIGGSIEADEVFIERLGSNSHIKATKSIVIRDMIGEGNILEIWYGVSEDNKEKLKELKKERKKLLEDKEFWQEEYHKNFPLFNNLKDEVVTLKGIIAKNPDMKETVMSINRKKINEFSRLSKLVSQASHIVHESQSKISHIELEIEMITTAILSTFITFEESFQSNNTLIFHVVEPELELKFVTDTHKMFKTAKVMASHGTYELVVE